MKPGDMVKNYDGRVSVLFHDLHTKWDDAWPAFETEDIAIVIAIDSITCSMTVNPVWLLILTSRGDIGWIAIERVKKIS